MLQCVECGVELTSAGDHNAICGRGVVCYVCGEMFAVIHQRTWWIEAQGAYLEEQKHKRRMLPGNEYLQ